MLIKGFIPAKAGPTRMRAQRKYFCDISGRVIKAGSIYVFIKGYTGLSAGYRRVLLKFEPAVIEAIANYRESDLQEAKAYWKRQEEKGKNNGSV